MSRVSKREIDDLIFSRDIDQDWRNATRSGAVFQRIQSGEDHPNRRTDFARGTLCVSKSHCNFDHDASTIRNHAWNFDSTVNQQPLFHQRHRVSRRGERLESNQTRWRSRNPRKNRLNHLGHKGMMSPSEFSRPVALETPRIAIFVRVRPVRM